MTLWAINFDTDNDIRDEAYSFHLPINQNSNVSISSITWKLLSNC